jgi:hypothetical protein
MAELNRGIGRHRDYPQVESINLNSSAAGGSGTDYEHPIAYIPNLALFAGAGTASDIPVNAQQVRNVSVIFEAVLNGVATNNFTLNILQRRAGALLVNTTSATTITAGAGVVVTPASMTNIVVGAYLYFSVGTGTAETVVVTAVTSTTFTATFVNGHSGGYAIAIAELAFVPHQFYVPITTANSLLPGDIVTIQRISNGTGLASPALTVGVDLVPAGIGR